MAIKSSKRILVLGPREAGALDLVRDLTGSAPDPDENGSVAGLTHEWNAKTAYYSADVPIWIDEVADVKAWKSEFTKPEAKEVVDAVGAWVYCFSKKPDAPISSETEEALKCIQDVVGHHLEDSFEVLKLAVAKPASKSETSGKKTTEEEEEICMNYEFEYIDYTAIGSNEFGEKVGLERLKEVLETNEWTTSADNDDPDLEDLDFDDDDGIHGIDRDEAEWTAEFFEVKASLGAEDEPEPDTEDIETSSKQADQVDNLERMMGKLLAVKEQSAGLPLQQRKQLAAKAVRDVMQENPTI